MKDGVDVYSDEILIIMRDSVTLLGQRPLTFWVRIIDFF